MGTGLAPRRRQPALLLEVAPEEAVPVPGAPQALRPEGPLHAPGGQPGPLQHGCRPPQEQHGRRAGQQAPRRGLAEQIW